ncbi:hydrogenase maturation protease [Solirubrobacter soli]|uniref:hydrogenase maturation protease n=1 Tax=Solirubrobacter soli TaxID=363832 RepID=UPI0003F81B45|nr:hydrogenase maturation protease [Solirubrobacter soli]
MKLRPRAGGDVFDLALAGKTAVVDTVETDMEGRVFVGVLVDDDPGRDLGERGHRFFFSPEEVAPLRVLVAGIGNVFLGDDGFGCALAARAAFEGVDVADFGIRGMDLAYALADYDVVVFLDAMPRGGAPGTLYVIEPDVDQVPAGFDAHGMDPVQVLALARTLGSALPRTLVLGCEPEAIEEFTGLSAPVEAALDGALKLLDEVLRKELS